MRFENRSCNICGSNEKKFIGRRFAKNNAPHLTTTVVRCGACSFIYPDPMPVRSPEEIQRDFNKPSEYFPTQSETRLDGFKRSLQELEKFMPSKGSLLDVGCGRGEFIYVAQNNGWQATGTDVSEAFVLSAREKFKVNALTGDILNLKLSESHYDVVTLMSVIQYVQDPAANLRKIYSLMKKDAVLMIEVTNEDALIFRIGDVAETLRRKTRATTRLSPLSPSYQLYGFNKKSLNEALVNAGFTVIYMKVSGATGGGNIQGSGPLRKFANMARKFIILLGGMTGNGHLIFCTARK